jgi:hypothetical protein
MTQEWKTLTLLGRALWAEPAQSRKHAVETLSAVSLHDFNLDVMMDRTVQGLVARALREPVSQRKALIHHPFYRLTPKERVILIGLHFGGWSYARLGRVLDLSPDEVSALAWRARLNLATQMLEPWSSKPLIHPPGSYGKHCPSYDPISPWSQKFLDEQFPKRERFFLQNHLMACSRCLSILNRTRDLYYRVEKSLPVNDQAPDVSEEAEVLFKIWKTGYHMTHPIEQTVLESLVRFFSRKETLWAIFLFLSAFLLILSFRG